MARFAFVTWDGGGNVSVALGIGVALVERGHAVTVLGPSSLQGLIEGVGLGYLEFGVSPPLETATRSAYLVEVVGSKTLASEFGPLMDALELDGVIVDCNLSWALEVPLAIPVAVLVHTAFGLYLPVWQPVIDEANAGRIAGGLPPFRPAADVWCSHAALVIASVVQFDRPLTPTPANARYVGLVRDPRPGRIPYTRSSGTESQPLVLVSYSTDPLQNGPERLQRALDGLANLPVRVVATTSGAFGAAHLSMPDNAVVVDYVSHDRVMAETAVVVGHAGHGTTLTALCRGVPMVCVPGIGRDQVPIADRVRELGLGIGLTAGATSEEIGSAVGAVLGDDSYRARVRRFAIQCDGRRGAETAAALLEEMLGHDLSKSADREEGT